MQREYTAIIERRYPGWYVAHCVEIPGAVGQGPTEEDAQKSLEEAITLILEDWQQDQESENEGHEGQPIVH
jgi:predicted RNase H-like HicB family nuclease